MKNLGVQIHLGAKKTLRRCNSGSLPIKLEYMGGLPSSQNFSKFISSLLLYKQDFWFMAQLDPPWKMD